MNFSSVKGEIKEEETFENDPLTFEEVSTQNEIGFETVNVKEDNEDVIIKDETGDSLSDTKNGNI